MTIGLAPLIIMMMVVDGNILALNAPTNNENFKNVIFDKMDHSASLMLWDIKLGMQSSNEQMSCIRMTRLY